MEEGGKRETAILSGGRRCVCVCVGREQNYELIIHSLYISSHLLSLTLSLSLSLSFSFSFSFSQLSTIAQSSVSIPLIHNGDIFQYSGNLSLSPSSLITLSSSCKLIFSISLPPLHLPFTHFPSASHTHLLSLQTSKKPERERAFTR